ncbi:WcaI family glycosyltransferase [Hufsiella ginkgonis]|uniref:WcaI family glycosyltransferase n=1 Tax=Hufsiella ginkgonis TaxID=2695274 RepID=A0A7K1Y338_9SPHI|nr:WcaI family glycosyltransferase [Hufsiella ginkgonis]MXV17439.1 WcaI family glycosyltransferase [Hufsiella ginkgonis]
MEKRRILLLSHNFSPEPVGIGKYNGEMIDWFAKKGHNCTVVTTFPYYPFWKVQAPYNNHWYKKEIVNYPGSGASVKIYRCPSYIPANPSGLKRSMQDLSFIVTKFWMILKLILLREKFDLIIAVAPPFHLAYLGLMLRNRSGGKLVYHIQDMQIEAAQRLNMLPSRRLFKELFKMEHTIMSGADYISSISEGMINKIKAKAKREVLFFPNWVDTASFYPLPLRHLLKEKWGYHRDELIYLYAGAIGEKQGLESVLDAAEILQHDKDIRFVICASGPYKERLVVQATQMGLRNISFVPVQDKEVFNEFLNMADLHLVLQKSNADDLVMPSKLATILSVGGASLVTSSAGTSLYKLINDFDLGYLVEPGDPKMFAAKINEIKQDTDLEKKRENARRYATTYLSLDKVMNDFAGQVLP